MRHNRCVTSDEIRELFLGFFEERGHLRLPSGSLVPASFDPSVLLTTAGMQPLKPYFLGQEKPPRTLLTTCQKSFRTVDIENVGTTTRHLTFFEMLGNFSIGEYFKQGAAEYAWELSLDGLRLQPRGHLGHRSTRATTRWAWAPTRRPSRFGRRSASRARGIVLLTARRTSGRPGRPGPAVPCSELYLDRGLEWGEPDDLPGGDNERFLEYWNLVFMQFDQDPVGTLTPLPAKNIDTGLGSTAWRSSSRACRRSSRPTSSCRS
jgi:alanyl-tRNA synthetase